MHHAPPPTIHPNFLTYLAVVFRTAFKHTRDGMPKQGSGAVVASSPDKRGDRSKQPPANGPKKECCKYHGGKFIFTVSSQPLFVAFPPVSPSLTPFVPKAQIWSCCRGSSWSQPCTTADEHRIYSYRPGQLEEQWRYHRTPAAAPGSTVHRAVASESPC